MAPTLADEVMGRGVEMSAAVIVDIVNIAYSVGEYAKQTLFRSKNDIMRAE